MVKTKIIKVNRIKNKAHAWVLLLTALTWNVQSRGYQGSNLQDTIHHTSPLNILKGVLLLLLSCIDHVMFVLLSRLCNDLLPCNGGWTQVKGANA